MKYLNLHTKLSDMGIDSHTALEIRRVVHKEFGISLSIKEMSTVTFARLNEMASMSKQNGFAA